MTISQHKMNAQPCLNCKREMSGATNPYGPGAPEVGAVTVCLYCGHLMEFGIGLVLVEPSDATIKEIAGDPRLISMMKFSGEFRRKFPPKDSK